MSEARGSLDQRAESTLVSIAVLIVLQFLGHATSAPMHLPHRRRRRREVPRHIPRRDSQVHVRGGWSRSEEHTSELQSRGHLVCRLLLEKKNTNRVPPASAFVIMAA